MYPLHVQIHFVQLEIFRYIFFPHVIPEAEGPKTTSGHVDSPPDPQPEPPGTAHGGAEISARRDKAAHRKHLNRVTTTQSEDERKPHRPKPTPSQSSAASDSHM